MESSSGSSRNANADLTSSRFQKTVCLFDWWLTKATEGFEGDILAVGGLTSLEHPKQSKHSCTRQVQRIFTSSPIIRRHDAFSLETADGICVVIKGLINKDRTMRNGFSSEIFNHFVFGFPPQWKECSLKYMGQESVSGVASPQEAVAGLEKSVPSSLNKETPVNHSEVISEERHDAQILEECSQDLPEVTTECIIKQGCQQTLDAEQERNHEDIMNRNGDHRRKSNRLSQPSTVPSTSSSLAGSEHMPEVATDEGVAEEGSQLTCDIEQGQNCGPVMNQDGGCERNSNTFLRPPIEPGIANSTPGLKRKRSTKQATSNSKIKRKISFDASGKSVNKEAIESMSKISLDALSFKRSRSGRLLIPHMEYWRNQIPVYDRNRSITGILEDSTVTPLRGSRSEPPRKRR